MKKDDELWLKKMREMLIEYDEPAPPGSWEKLDQELRFSVKKRIIPKQVWAAAAAVLLLAVSGVSFYFLKSPVANEIRTVSTPQVNVVPDVLPVVPVIEDKSVRIEPLDKTSGTPISLVAHIPSKTNPESDIIPVIQEPESSEPVIEESGKEENTVSPEEKDMTAEKQPVLEDIDDNRLMARPSGKDKLHLPVNREQNSSSRNGKNWSMGLSVNSLGSTSLDNNDTGDTHSRSMSMVDIANIGQTTDYVDISHGELKFDNGLPYVVENPITYDHKQPITFGLSVRKGITSSISLETGLTYTYLASDIHQKGSKIGEQKLHYVGIPLRANWSFVNTNKFNLYVNAGGAVEKCVHGKKEGNSNTVKPLQFSLAGGIGAQFNITKKLGLYAEPGVAYFFDDGSDTETIRKEKKFNINLQAGLRLTY